MANSTSRIQLANYLSGNGIQDRNYILNSNAFRNTTENIVLGAGVSAGDVTRNTSSPLTAISDFQIVLNSATNEYVEWTLDTIDRADQNGNCEFSGSYKLSLGSGATVQAQVYQGGNLTASIDLPAESASRRFLLNVPCGTSTTTVRFAQTVAVTTSTLNVAGLYYGRASNIGSVAQATMYGWLRYPATANCNWDLSTGSFSNFSADADCVSPTGSNLTGNAAAPATKIPGIRFPNGMPAGDYQIVATAKFQNAASSNNVCHFRFTDGTNNSGSMAAFVGGPATYQFPVLAGKFSYTAARGDTTIQIQAYGDSSTTCNVRADSDDLEITVTRFPSSSEIAVRPEQMFRGGSARTVGAANCQWQFNSTSFGDFSADADCNAPSVTGQALAPTTKIPGIRFSSIPAGDYLIMAAGSFRKNAASQVCYFRFSDGTNSSAGMEVFTDGTNTVDMPVLMGRITYTSPVGDTTIRIQSANDGSINCEVNASIAGKRDLEITLIPLSQSLPAPLLVGSVTSNSTGAERIERARINCDSGSAITSQSGSWISSVGNVSSGTCTLTLASGMFSAAPSCTATIVQSATSTHAVKISSTAAGSVVSLAIDSNSGATLSSYDFDIICMGPR